MDTLRINETIWISGKKQIIDIHEENIYQVYKSHAIIMMLSIKKWARWVISKKLHLQIMVLFWWGISNIGCGNIYVETRNRNVMFMGNELLVDNIATL